jgi:hypothetical protein
MYRRYMYLRYLRYQVPTVPTVGTYGTVGTSLYCGIRSQRACVALNVLSEDTLEQASLSPE